jgi:glycogen(starch) synthase
MNIPVSALDLAPPAEVWQLEEPAPDAAPRNGTAHRRRGRDQEFLRRCAWEIGEAGPAEAYAPTASQVGLAMVNPTHGFAHWRILPGWVDEVARRKGDGWHGSRLVLRLYDVSQIHFNGLNAHAVRDLPLPSLCGQLFFTLPRPGTWQLAEPGFVLRGGEFVPAARSHAVAFAPDAPSGRTSHAALLVTPRGHVEEVGNVWEQGRVLAERRRPRLRRPLRLAVFAWPDGQGRGLPARFATELAAGTAGHGHEVHVFVPASDGLRDPRAEGGAHYHPIDVVGDGTPLELAEAFGRAAAARLAGLPPFDLAHAHEWMSQPAARAAGAPTVLSLGSVEATRCNGAGPGPLSRAVEEAERAAAGAAEVVLTADWLRPQAVAALGLDPDRVHAFPLEGRLENEWERPLDYGRVKEEIGVGPVDRLLLFVGPLEHAAGVDLLVEALPTLLHRAGNLRLAFVGAGGMHGHLAHRAGQLGVAFAVRLLGHVEGPRLRRLLRAAEALVLPSRYRVPFDDAVVDLARRAGRPVVTTHGGPAHLVRHEENGLVTYDNPGSMVWALDRVLGDPGHAERMGQNGRRREDAAPRWSEVAHHYLELCAARLPQLTQPWE